MTEYGSVVVIQNGDQHEQSALGRLSGVPDRRGSLVRALSVSVVRLGGLFRSRNRHARAQNEETDHPIAVLLGVGAQVLWCHVHQRAV